MDVSQGTLDVLMFILGSNVTLSEAKQKKPVWAGPACVYGLQMYLYLSLCV